MNIALVGPCAPQDVAALTDMRGATSAAAFPGYRGIPVSELAKSLVRAGHRVTVVSTGPTELDQPLEFSGPGFSLVVQRGRPRRRQSMRDLYAMERAGIVDILRDVSPDIVHAHWTYQFELAAQESRLLHVTTAHDAPVTILRQMRNLHALSRLAMALRARSGIRHLSAVSPYVADRWRKEMAFSRGIQVIPNSIPESALTHHRSPASHPVILDVADSGKRKNIRGLLRAFSVVRARVRDAELRLVGPGLGMADPLAMWAKYKGLAGGVSFVGGVDQPELADEYRRAWLFVHASMEESFGLTVLEAVASGLPVIGGRDSGGVPFVLNQGRAGWLADMRDPHALARAIVGLVCDGPPEPPQGAVSYVRGHFSPSTVAQQYLDWYSQSIQAGGYK